MSTMSGLHLEQLQLLVDKQAAEIERLRSQCEGLYQSARKNGQELLLRERAMEDTATFLEGLAARLEGWPHGYIDNSPSKAATDCRAMAARLRGET